jgi:DNA-directed RNA polymerase subunit alpha
MPQDTFLELIPKIKCTGKEENKATFVIEPFYPGYGVTIGNSLRRVLLSSLEGAAITAVKIKGVSHEFSTIPHVREDVVEIILNLKTVCIKSYSQKPITLKLQAKGKKEIKAEDIQKSADIEIANPDLHIATLGSPKAELDMEMKVERGRGHLPVEDREDEELPPGIIAIDAIFTPVKKVSYNVELTRVGRMTNLEKLNIEIVTNGTIPPEEALEQASKILVEHFRLFTPEGEGKKKVTRAPSKKAMQEAKAKKYSVEEVDFSSRTTNALLINNIKTIGKITTLTEEDIKKLKGFGSVALEEVEAKLKEFGLELKASKKTK